MTPVLRSVHVGRPRDARLRQRSAAPASRSDAVDGPVVARRLGLDGDQVTDTRHHGGVDKAVYAFAREDLDHWGEVLGQAHPGRRTSART